MRFGEHFCAAELYKQGICRDICVKVFEDFFYGAVGFLINGAQRASKAGTGGYGDGETTAAMKKRSGRNFLLFRVFIWSVTLGSSSGVSAIISLGPASKHVVFQQCGSDGFNDAPPLFDGCHGYPL